MRKLDLSSWAAISEIIATIAVVVSLLFLAYSIKRNADEMETSNANFLYQLDEQVAGDLSRESSLAEILVKIAQKQELSDVEKVQYENLQHRNLVVWEMAWTQYKSGSLAFDEWTDWNNYKTDAIRADLPQEWWLEIRSDYKPDFARHVDAVYEDN